MDDGFYQRPREKLRDRGPASLSVAELIQVIIGSGSSKVSAAKIARAVHQSMDDGNVSYDVLVSLSGVGDAKACQILAALELSGRIACDSS